jgi:large subunit ribosomal protein L15
MAEDRIGLHSLQPAPGSRKEKKRVGRGEGSGTGKTSGRGHKGAGARSGSKRRVRFEGGQNPIHMRMHKLRGPHMKKSMPFEKFTVHAHGFSKTAREKIEAAGGTAQLIEE